MPQPRPDLHVAATDAEVALNIALHSRRSGHGREALHVLYLATVEALRVGSSRSWTNGPCTQNDRDKRFGEVFHGCPPQSSQ